jgi:hypothetical protein
MLKMAGRHCGWCIRNVSLPLASFYFFLKKKIELCQCHWRSPKLPSFSFGKSVFYIVNIFLQFPKKKDNTGSDAFLNASVRFVCFLCATFSGIISIKILSFSLLLLLI